MKTKEEVIDGFLQRHCALLMDANMPAYNAIRSQLDGIWQNGYMAGINCSEQSVEIAKHKWYEEGYNKGYEEGQNRISHKPVINELFEVAADKKKAIEDEAYQRGLDDSWEAARKMVCMNQSECLECFGDGNGQGSSYYYLDGIYKIEPQEAIDKIKAWEEKKKADEEIRVGDEVVDQYGTTSTVTQILNNYVYGIRRNGYFCCEEKQNLHKTGRHFDIVEQPLKETGGEKQP